MDKEAQLKLQAYLDGELPESEARQVGNRLAQDREYVALLAELRNTRQALVGFEIGITLPESREFFWSKIQREISREETIAPTTVSATGWTLWRKFLFPAGALAGLALAGLIALLGSAGFPTAETAVADPGAFTYHDFSARTTLVWFSYPAENDVADESPAATVQ